MPSAVCPGRNTGIQLEEKGYLTGRWTTYDQAAKDVTNVVYID